MENLIKQIISKISSKSEIPQDKNLQTSFFRKLFELYD